MKWYHWLFGYLVLIPAIMLGVAGADMGPWIFFGCTAVSALSVIAIKYFLPRPVD